MLSLMLIGTPMRFIFSYLGTCVCGECSCHDVDPTGDWGDIHGDTCECDERDCRAVYDRYSDDFCSGKVAPDSCFYKKVHFLIMQNHSNSHIYRETVVPYAFYILQSFSQ